MFKKKLGNLQGLTTLWDYHQFIPILVPFLFNTGFVSTWNGTTNPSILFLCKKKKWHPNLSNFAPFLFFLNLYGSPFDIISCVYCFFPKLFHHFHAQAKPNKPRILKQDKYKGQNWMTIFFFFLESGILRAEFWMTIL